MLKNSDLTRIFFRFLKEYSKKSYYSIYRLWQNQNFQVDNIETTLYETFLNAYQIYRPQDIILRMWQCSSFYGDKDRKMLWSKEFHKVDEEWLKFVNSKKICEKFMTYSKSNGYYYEK